MRRIAKPLSPALIVLLLATSTTTAWSQSPPDLCRSGGGCAGGVGDEWAQRWQAHVFVLGINAAVGALTAGVVQYATGGSFETGFLRGAAGGGLTYAGKLFSTRHTFGAKLIGRQTAAIGASVTRNAITGAGPLERLSLPLGPIRINLSSEESWVTLDLPTLVGAVYGMTRPGSEFNLGESLATGTLVFEVDLIRPDRNNHRILGNAIGGTVLYRRDPLSVVPVEDIIAHEMIHVIQNDFEAIAFGTPFEEWAIQWLPKSIASPMRHLDLGTQMVIRTIPKLAGVESRDAPWEREAHFMVPGHRVGGKGHIGIQYQKPVPPLRSHSVLPPFADQLRP